MLFHNHLVNIAQILEEETAMAQIRIHVLHCGKIGVAPNLPASAQWRWPAKADARRLKNDARIWLPVSAYLVEHPKGLFLVDAGLPRTVSPTGIEDRAAQLRMFGRGWYTLVHSVVEPGQSIGEQLAARGIRPQDLDYVLFSHLDPDHIAGISEVRGAKRLLVAEEEYFWSCRVNLQAVDGRAAGTVLVPREPHRAREPLIRPVRGRFSSSRARRRAHGGHVRNAHPQW